MGVNILEDSKESMTCEKIRSPSSSTLFSNRIMGVPVRPWKTRSKSQSRLAVTARCYWNHEGPGRWRNNQGQLIVMNKVPLLQTFETERVALQKLGLTRLQEINIGCPAEIPKLENAPTQPIKKRTILLRKKAVTTNFFDSKEREKGSNLPVFGVPLSQCLENDRLRMRNTNNDSNLSIRMGQKNHCEELLSLLRITPSNTMNPCIPKDDSFIDTRFLSPTMQQGLEITRESLPDIHFGELQVPLVVQSCIRFLREKGLNTLGIFRVSGAQKRVRQLREDFDNNKLLIVDDSSQPHDVAQLLKEYFRDLPEPLLTRALYGAFLNTQSIPDLEKRIKVCRWLIYLLPVVHRDTLATLLAFLEKVSLNSEDYQRKDGTWVAGNKMNVHNLATVFGPNLLRLHKSSSDSSYSIHSAETTQERSDMILTVRLLIENYRELFQVTTEDLDDIYLQFMLDDPDILNAILSRRNDILKFQGTSSTTNQNELFYEEKQINQDMTKRASKQESTLFSRDIVNAPEVLNQSSEKFSRGRPLKLSKGELEKTFDSTKIQSVISSDKSSEYRYVDRRASGGSGKNIFSSTYAVTAAFTIKMATKGSPSILPINVVEQEQKPSPRSRRVPYGKTRHLTTPAYVTEETITNITIPPPKNYFRQGGITPPSMSQSRMDDIISKSSSRMIPMTTERWKRQELIASEHTQY